MDELTVSKTTTAARIGQKNGRELRVPDARRSQAAILDAAYQLFTEAGFAKTTIADIAAAAGVAKGLVLFHFKTKEDVLTEVIQRVIPTLLTNVEAFSENDERSAEQMLRDALRQIFSNLVKQPYAGAVMRLLMSEGRRVPSLSKHYYSEVVSRGNAALTRIVEIGKSRGEFLQTSNEQISLVLLGPAIGAVFWQLLFTDFETLDVDRLCETHIEIALHGLLRRS